MTISDLYPLKKHVLRRYAELPAEEVGAALAAEHIVAHVDDAVVNVHVA